MNHRWVAPFVSEVTELEAEAILNASVGGGPIDPPIVRGDRKVTGVQEPFCDRCHREYRLARNSECHG